MSNYRPRVGSVPFRVIRWLTDNPDEELTRADVASKFELALKSVQNTLADAVKLGALLYVQNEDLEWVYRLGVRHAGNPFSALASGIATALPVGAAEPTPELIERLVVDDNVPIKKPKTSAESRWEPLFSKLKRQGQSIAVPAEWRISLARDAGRRNRAAKNDKALPTFKVGNDHASGLHARVWRIT